MTTAGGVGDATAHLRDPKGDPGWYTRPITFTAVRRNA